MDWSRAAVDDYRDSAGLTYRDGVAAELSGSASAKLFFQRRFGRNTVRPFAQAGVAQRLAHTNAVEIEGRKYTFDDADLGMFGRLGVDIDTEGFQSYLAVRGEKSADREVISLQIGLTMKLD
jgi:hypothetical protein